MSLLQLAVASTKPNADHKGADTQHLSPSPARDKWDVSPLAGHLSTDPGYVRSEKAVPLQVNSLPAIKQPSLADFFNPPLSPEHSWSP